MTQDSSNQPSSVLQTKAWLEQVVIAYQLCPFARKPYDLGQIRVIASAAVNPQEILTLVAEECKLLLKTSAKQLETTLIVLEVAFLDFMDYWNFVGAVEDWLVEAGYEGVFQVASFHPNYLFGGSREEDPANFTNRSPFPMLHLLREDSLEEALSYHKAPEAIPVRNIHLMQEKGTLHWTQILHRIKEKY